ncbi:MAG: toxin-activating lysine-acyltransferase [Mesorhizobium sp.]|nr:MAG: toxin-activating lysine-acyltransferase [Mesorhizobium sp.]
MASRFLGPFESLGMIVSICANSNYRIWSIADIKSFIVPAVNVGQCKIYFDGENWPIAFVTWALVNEEYHDALLREGANPPAKEWNSGANLWFMDIVAPPMLTLHIIRDMQRNYFSNRHAHSIRRNPDGSVKRVQFWKNALTGGLSSL